MCWHPPLGLLPPILGNPGSATDFGWGFGSNFKGQNRPLSQRKPQYLFQNRLNAALLMLMCQCEYRRTLDLVWDRVKNSITISISLCCCPETLVMVLEMYHQELNPGSEFQRPNNAVHQQWWCYSQGTDPRSKLRFYTVILIFKPSFCLAVNRGQRQRGSLQLFWRKSSSEKSPLQRVAHGAFPVGWDGERIFRCFPWKLHYVLAELPGS